MKFIRFLVLILILGVLVQTACAPSQTATPSETTSSPETVSSSDSCPPTSPGLSLYKDTEAGYCLLYPSEYGTSVPGYIIINPVSGPGDIPGDAWVSIATENAGGRTADQIANALIDDVGPGFNITHSEQAIEGETAIVIDGLPGQDSHRRVIIVHNDIFYMLYFAPWYPSPQGAEQLTPLEDLYNSVMSSIHFLPDR